jgi:hypothetical protein
MKSAIRDAIFWSLITSLVLAELLGNWDGSLSIWPLWLLGGLVTWYASAARWGLRAHRVWLGRTLRHIDQAIADIARRPPDADGPRYRDVLCQLAMLYAQRDETVLEIKILGELIAQGDEA